MDEKKCFDPLEPMHVGAGIFSDVSKLVSGKAKDGTKVRAHQQILVWRRMNQILVWRTIPLDRK